MSLSQLSLNASLTWELARANTGFDDAVQGPETATFSLQGLDLTVWNELYAAQYTLSPSASQAVDLYAFTDLASDVITSANKALLVMILTAGFNTVLNVKPHGTNPMQWFFGSATDSVNIPAGGCLVFSEGEESAGTTIDATHRQLLLTNTGSASVTVKILVAVSDV